MSGLERKNLNICQLTPYLGQEFFKKLATESNQISGHNLLRIHRPTRLPAGSRVYTQGDPITLIDWRVFARHEQLIVRQQPIESHFSVDVFVDLSDSTDWPDDEAREFLGATFCKKKEVIWRLACHLTYNLCNFGNRVRIIVKSEDRWISMYFQSHHELAFFYESLVSNVFFFDVKNIKNVKISESLQLSRSDFLLWISDGIDGIPEYVMKSGNKKKIWLHVLFNCEQDFTWLPKQMGLHPHQVNEKPFSTAEFFNKDNLTKLVAEWLSKTLKDWGQISDHYLRVDETVSISTYLTQLSLLLRGN